MSRGTHNNHPKANRQHRWNDGRILSSHGYAKVRVGRSHPLADPNGYAYEHLLVWVSAGNPRPPQDKVIHHKNEVKTDNRLENLELIDRVQHAAEHYPSMLTDEAVRSLREEYAGGEDGTVLAEKYGIPVARVYRIIHGQTRKSAGGPIQSKSLRKNANRNRSGHEHQNLEAI